MSKSVKELVGDSTTAVLPACHCCGKRVEPLYHHWLDTFLCVTCGGDWNDSPECAAVAQLEKDAWSEYYKLPFHERCDGKGQHLIGDGATIADWERGFTAWFKKAKRVAA